MFSYVRSKKNIILSIILLITVSLPFFYQPTHAEPGIIISPFPNGSDNIFILTVDDLSLDTARQYGLADNLTAYLENQSIPATYFAIPAYTGPYNFSWQFEIAQHGYNHISPEDGSFCEYKNIPDEEVRSLLLEGRTLLEKNGYHIHGHRAPCLNISSQLLDCLRENYAYDSSFLAPVDNYSFIIPANGNDLLKGACNTSYCNRTILLEKKNLFRALLSQHDSGQKPIIILSHFFDYEYALNNPHAREYLDNFFEGIKSRNYWTTTMYSYQIWRNALESVTWSEKSADNTHLEIEFSHCLVGLTFSTPSPRQVISNCALGCTTRITGTGNSIQSCIIRSP